MMIQGAALDKWDGGAVLLASSSELGETVDVDNSIILGHWTLDTPDPDPVLLKTMAWMTKLN